MRYFILSILLIGLLAGISSCEYEVIQPKQVEVPDSLSFAEDVLPIFDGCTACHSGATPPDLSENVHANLTGASGGDSYVNTDNPEESELYVKLAEENHYPDIKQEELALILEWIKDGAPDN